MEHEGGMVFIESLAELLRRLLDYRTVQQGDEYRDLLMHVMFNLLVSVCVCVCVCVQVGEGVYVCMGWWFGRRSEGVIDHVTYQ